MRRRTTARWLAAAAVLFAALTTGGGSAHADPPGGWAPGTEFDYGRILFTQKGWIEGRAGNYHTGDIEAEEDDDGVTGFLADWFCKGDAVPPSPYSPDPVDPRCKLRNMVGLYEGDGSVNLATFDQARNRVGIHLDVDTLDVDTNEVNGSVRIDLTIAGRGAAEITHDETATELNYEEWWYGVKAWGKIDGHRLDKRNTVIHSGKIGFWLYQWTRVP